MKNLKKVLALVLAFACAFTMLAGAVVYPDVPAGSDYSEAITMLSDLGVITGDTDGKYHPENTITRAEACALIARLLTGETDVSKYTGASNFPDVAKTSWYESAVGYCVANGIVRGYPDGTFKPAVQITDAEFVTMLVRAMGYETTSNPLSYPYGYISAAQTAGLLEDVTVVPASGALRGEDAQMLYNAMFADFARGAKFINTTHGTTVEEYPTIAEEVFKLNRAAVGTTDKDGNLQTCKAHTWVITGKVCTPGEVDKIQAYPIKDGDSDLYAIEKKVAPVYFTYEGDVDALVGYQVELWGEGQHSEPEYDKDTEGYYFSKDWDIKAIKTVKGQTTYTYTPADEDLPDTDFDDVKLFSETKESAVKDVLQTKNSAKYTMMDWDSDGDVDYIDTEMTTYIKVTSVSKSTVRGVLFDGTKVSLDTDGKTDGDKAFDDSKYKNYVINAELPEDLEEGDILAVTTDCVAGKKTTDWNWTVELVEPETMEVTKVDTKKGVYFDDELIEVADNQTKPVYYFDGVGAKDGVYYKMNESNIDNWDLWLDANGFIIYMAESDSSAGYFFVTGLKNGKNVTGNRDQMVVSGVYGDNTKAKDVKIANTAYIYVDGKNTNVYDKSTHALNNKVTNKYDVIGNAYKYSMNEDGEITRLTEVALTDKDSYNFNENTDRFEADGNYWLDSAKVIFAVRKNDAYGSNNVTAHPQDEISLDDVMAVAYKDVPSIGISGANTSDWGVKFDSEEKSADVTTAVLGVDSFRYFSNISDQAALITNVIYNARTDNYTIEGIFPGRDGTSFDTIDEDDFTADTKDVLDDLYTELNKNSNSKHAVYAETEFDKDGKITTLFVMDKASDNYATTGESHEKYTTYRAVADRVSTSNRLTANKAESNGDGKIYTYNTADFEQYWKLTDDTKYYEVDADLVMPKDGDILNPYTDAFEKEIKLSKITEGDKSDLDSFIENTADEEDEYVVVDVIVDGNGNGKDAVAVFYYKDTVKEADKNAPKPEVTEMDVNSKSDWIEALGNEKIMTINLKTDLTLDNAAVLDRADLTINGNGHKITAPSVQITANGITLNDVAVESASEYAVQVYKTHGVTLKDVTATSSAKGAILVNGSVVTLSGTTTVNGEWGGVEVSKGKNVTTAPKLTVKGDLVNKNASKPVVWIDGYKMDKNEDGIAASAVVGMDDYTTQENTDGSTVFQLWFLSK